MKFNDPTPKYTTQPNGDVTVEWLPPTALMMTAHREMEKFQEILGGQQRTMNTMQEHINYLETYIQNLDNVIMELKDNDGKPQPTSSPDTTGTSAGESEPEGDGGRTPP